MYRSMVISKIQTTSNDNNNSSSREIEREKWTESPLFEKWKRKEINEHRTEEMIIAIKNLFTFHLNGALHTLTETQCIDDMHTHTRSFVRFATESMANVLKWTRERSFIPFIPNYFLLAKDFQSSKYSNRVLLGRKCACVYVYLRLVDIIQ